jgi:hypothetical protein
MKPEQFSSKTNIRLNSYAKLYASEVRLIVLPLVGMLYRCVGSLHETASILGGSCFVFQLNSAGKPECHLTDEHKQNLLHYLEAQTIFGKQHPEYQLYQWLLKGLQYVIEIDTKRHSKAAATTKLDRYHRSTINNIIEILLKEDELNLAELSVATNIAKSTLSGCMLGVSREPLRLQHRQSLLKFLQSSQAADAWRTETHRQKLVQKLEEFANLDFTTEVNQQVSKHLVELLEKSKASPSYQVLFELNDQSESHDNVNRKRKRVDNVVTSQTEASMPKRQKRQDESLNLFQTSVYTSLRFFSRKNGEGQYASTIVSQQAQHRSQYFDFNTTEVPDSTGYFLFADEPVHPREDVILTYPRFDL